MVKRFIVETQEHHAFKNDEERTALAKYLAAIMRAASHIDTSTPYMVREGDTHRWVLDNMNDWWLQFDPENNRRYHIQHRNTNEEATQAITRWVAYRYGYGNTVLEIEL
jgi:hypothetical protein